MSHELNTFKYLPYSLVNKLQGLKISCGRPMDGDRQNQHRSSSYGASVEFAEYRAYRPGDPIQRIDWSVYARTDRYMIREAHEEVSARTYILLDVSHSMAYRHEGMISKMEHACFLAAGMMFMMTRQGDTAGLITFDNEVRDYFKPTGSATGLKPVLTHLETLRPAAAGDIERSLHKAAELITGRALVIVISDLLQPPDRIIRGLHHLHHDGKDVTIFHVLDPAELTLPMTGLADLTEMETGKKLCVDLDEVRNLYTEQVNLYLEELHRGCLNLNFDYLLADTRTPPYESLRKRSRKL